jgi:hypothetical protein
MSCQLPVASYQQEEIDRLPVTSYQQGGMQLPVTSSQQEGNDPCAHPSGQLQLATGNW